MRCSNCGCDNENSAKTCQVCGCQLSEEYNNSMPKYENEKSLTKQKNLDKNKIIMIVLVVIIAIVIIIGVCLISNMTNKTDDTYNNVLSTTFGSDDENLNSDEFVTEEATETKITVATTLSEKEATKQKALEYLKKADDALKNGEREGALQMADAALSLYDEEDIDDDIQKKYDKICEYAPFNLYKYDNVLKIDWPDTDYYGNVFLYDRDCTSNTNKNYSHCILFETRTSYSEDHVDVYYNFAGKYDRLSGTILLTNDNKNTDQNNCYITIYGDGKKLYTSKDMVSGCLEKSFDIKVSGVETLVVSYHRDTDEYSEYAISNFVALKDLP